MSDPEYPLRWHIYFHFAEPYWFHDRSRTERMLDAFAGTAWFRELDRFGNGRARGFGFGSLDVIRPNIVSGLPGRFTFVRGTPEDATLPEMAEAAMVFEVRPTLLRVFANARGLTLARLGERAVDDVVDATLALADAFSGIATIATATATPGRELALPRELPPNESLRPATSVVDLIDPTLPDDILAASSTRVARAIANSAVPEGVVRTKHGDVIVDRWVRDPSDRDALADAACRHAEWVATLV